MLLADNESVEAQSLSSSDEAIMDNKVREKIDARQAEDETEANKPSEEAHNAAIDLKLSPERKPSQPKEDPGSP